MEFKDFLAYLKTIPLPVAYQEAIDTLKPYGSVIISFERTLGQPGDSLVLSDPEALVLVYQFVYWALRRDAVDINVPLIEAAIGPMLSMDIMISNVGCEQPYTEDALEITRIDWANQSLDKVEFNTAKPVTKAILEIRQNAFGLTQEDLVLE